MCAQQEPKTARGENLGAEWRFGVAKGGRAEIFAPPGPLAFTILMR